MTQLTLEWPPFSPAFGRADFLVSNCNAAALARVESWPDGPSRALVLYGPGGSGKSHLAHLWRERTGAMLIPGDARRCCICSTAVGRPAPGC
jgi:chromosomal replication initiation ATPase DnaA